MAKLNLKELFKNLSPPIYVAKKKRTDDGIDSRIVAFSDRHSYVAEQYKVLRTNLYSLTPGKKIKTILLTSAQPQDGKTTTSCNLAATLSLDKEKKTLIVDGDFRKSLVHKIFSVPKTPGFSEILSKEADVSYFTQKPSVRNLYIIPAGSGRGNLSEVLSSERVKDIIESLKEKFDYIIFDSPPVLNVTDACLLGSLCDIVLLVVRADVTQKSVIKEAFDLLRNAQAKPAACILDNVVVSYYSYYKYRYSYRYGYEKKATQENK
jgi:capsular exopolysaccharide synthesis family protein